MKEVFLIALVTIVILKLIKITVIEIIKVSLRHKKEEYRFSALRKTTTTCVSSSEGIKLLPSIEVSFFNKSFCISIGWFTYYYLVDYKILDNKDENIIADAYMDYYKNNKENK